MKTFKEFFSEAEDDGPNERSVKERIKREKNADRRKWDRLLDRAMIDDARLKAQKTKPKQVRNED